MRKLGDQWIEVIDGKEHMLKCTGLADDMSIIIKDLGILREGKLPSSFGVYPTTEAPSEENEPWCLYAWLAKDGKIIRKEQAWGETEQEVKDAWNRRA